MLARFFGIAMHARKPDRLLAVFAFVAIGLLCAAIPLTAAADEVAGTVFTGTGFVDDLPVADGTVVEALIRGVTVAAIETFDSVYELYVVEPSGESFEGDVVSFKLGGYETAAIVGWEKGTRTRLDLYAYSGHPGEGGDGIVYPVPFDMTAIRELEARLVELERERSELAAELDRQVDIAIAIVTNQWERAFEEFRAEVEREIQQVVHEFELEQRQIPLGPGRESIFRRLEAEFDAFMEGRQAEFEFDLELKQGYLNDEILEIEMRRDLELDEISQFIYQIKTEIIRQREKIGLPVETPGDAEPPDFDPPRDPVGPPIDGRDRPTPREPGRNRGFFTNSISADPDVLNTLDPMALAVIGILITLAATGVQLLKGS